jgi:hypothetical protein
MLNRLSTKGSPGAKAQCSEARGRARALGRAAPLAAALAVTAGSAGEARAADFVINAETVGQAYEVGSPWGDTVLARRRFMQTLGLGVYNLQGAYTPGQADYSVVLKLRLDADFGINSHVEGSAETNYKDGRGNRFVPGLQEAPLDLMYGYVEGRNLAKGWLGFRAGRQYMSDMLGWWSFDGGLVRITTPYYVQAEVYGGLEQRGGLPLSSSRFEQQGIWRGSHSGFSATSPDEPSASDFPSYQFANVAPAFGVALESSGPSWIHGRFSYRRVYNTGTTITQQFPDPEGGFRTANGLRLSQERIGYAADVNKDNLGGLKGGFSYDLYNQLVGSAFGGIDVYLGKRATVGADVDYFVPTFDADSIWNWFTHSPVTTITGRASVDVTERLDFAASGGVRLWTSDGDPDAFGIGQCAAAGLGPECVGRDYFDPSTVGAVRDFSRAEENRETSATLDALGNVAGRYRLPSASFGLRGMFQLGERGRRAGGDLTADKYFDGRRYTLGGRVSLYNWNDPLRPGRGATSFGYVLGAGYKPAQVADFRLEWEHDMNRLVGHRFRVLALANVLVMK